MPKEKELQGVLKNYGIFSGHERNRKDKNCSLLLERYMMTQV
jgi:hypothetical protein